MKKRRRAIIIILSALLLVGAAAVYAFLALDTPTVVAYRRRLIYGVLGQSTVDTKLETAGLAEGYALSEYEDGETRTGEFDEWRDNCRVYDDGKISRLVSYYGGYQIDLPSGTEYDFNTGSGAILASGEGFSAVISREYAPYQSKKEIVNFALDCLFPFLGINRGVEDYIAYYEYRFLLSPEWQAANRVTVRDASVNDRTLVCHATVADAPDGEYDGYTYVTALKETREYIRVMLRYDASDEALRERLTAGASGMRLFDPRGNLHTDTEFSLVTPEWNDETAELFDKISTSDEIMWGVFTRDINGEGIDKTVPELEAKLDYEFEVILDYVHLKLWEEDGNFPTDFMQKCKDGGKIVELTYQITRTDNLELYGKSPLLDVWRGEYDEFFREFAREAKAFGHPFLFRLCNEMNSDWTSYSGVVNLCDPQIYASVWRRIYDIFEAEGADNCIWIYNPNDRNCPPSEWNDGFAYYPGNGYVHMLGVTGYNNGTYYEKWAESWREFDEIFDAIESRYGGHFGDFPWIITEFSSSSVGGDKAAWIDNMFEHIGDYKNIKIAVWFSYADFDGDIPARPYWLDENEKTTAAFKSGLSR